MMTLNKSNNFPITNQERLTSELRKIRRNNKITQQKLAERANVARRTITNAEASENIGLKEFCRIANALGYELTLRPKDTVLFEDLANVFKDE